MAPRSPHDFSLWPERARPARRRFSASRVAGVVSAGLVCLVAGYAVVSELARPSVLEPPIGRSWETFAASEQTGALPVAATAATTGIAPASAPAAARSIPTAEKPTADAVRPRSRGAVTPVARAPIGTVGPTGATDGRSVPDGSPKPAPSAAAQAAPIAAPPVKDGVEQKVAGLPKEAIVAADDEKPAATERPKPRKKAHKKTRPRTYAADPWGGNYRRAEADPRYGYRPGGFFPY